MADYIKNLKDDLLEQFKDRPNVEALCEVIGEQLNDVYAFFEQLKNKRNINDAEGTQLDGAGDIVCMSRLEAAQLDGAAAASVLPDETYRKYLIYKILKNTCRCTYYEMMNAINMFWTGPPLTYSEDISKPAKILLAFDAEGDSAKQLEYIPYIKAGGVGLEITMKLSDTATCNVGFGERLGAVMTISGNAPVLEEREYYSDENGNLLTDESGYHIIV